MSRQVYNEGYEILYCQNTAKTTIDVDPYDTCSTIKCLGRFLPLDDSGTAIACRFIKWDVSVKLNINTPGSATTLTFKFVSGILRAVPKLNKLMVQLNLWKYADCPGFIASADPHDLDDIMEQILRPFSIIRVRQVDFIDKEGHSISAASSLSTLMMSDTSPSPIMLHELYDDLISFLCNSLAEQSWRAIKIRLKPLEIARDQDDVNVFRSTLRSFLIYLSQFRALVPPQHIVEFAQDSASAETRTGEILGHPKEFFAAP